MIIKNTFQGSKCRPITRGLHVKESVFGTSFSVLRYPKFVVLKWVSKIKTKVIIMFILISP